MFKLVMLFLGNLIFIARKLFVRKTDILKSKADSIKISELSPLDFR